jgi:hypothetical protein
MKKADENNPRIPIGTVLEVIVNLPGRLVKYNLAIGERLVVSRYLPGEKYPGVYLCHKLRKNSMIPTTLSYEFPQTSLEYNLLDVPRSGYFDIVPEDQTGRANLEDTLGEYIPRSP